MISNRTNVIRRIALSHSKAKGQREGEIAGHARVYERGSALRCIPPARAPSAEYQSWVVAGSFLYVSGQISDVPGLSIKGIVGQSLSLREGVDAGRLCGLNIAAQILDATSQTKAHVDRILKLTVYVRAVSNLENISAILESSSAALDESVGQAPEACTVVGVTSLPREHAVEADSIVLLRKRIPGSGQVLGTFESAIGRLSICNSSQTAGRNTGPCPEVVAGAFDGKP